jgi:sugar lactone lactonase YvrE
VIDIAAEPRSTLGEGPLWDHRVGRMLWVDIAGGAVNILMPSAGSTERIELGENVGCLALTKRVDTVVAALRSGWHWLDLDTGERRLIASLPAPANSRFNDGAVDTAGRFWTGTLEDGERNPVGELFQLDTDLSYRAVDGGFLCSNGIAWSLDERWMFFVDSRRNAIYRYRFEPETGAIEDRELFIDTGPFSGIPDGIEIDCDGLLWCAFWGGARVIAFDQQGVPRHTIDVPALQPTSVTFGGPDLQTMYITSARFGLTPSELATWPASGALFALERPVPGRPANVFGGTPAR